MEIGKCHLCDETGELRHSHVWSAFTYKRFAADQSKGGRFADLSKQRLSNVQEKRYWFCRKCEQILGNQETYAAQYCDRIMYDPLADQPYDESLLRFATSISWRTMKLYYEDQAIGGIKSRWKAYDYWKRYLRGSRPGVNPYTQHIFIVNDKIHGLHKALGGQVFEEYAYVLSQIGPLHIVGLLNPDGLSKDDQRTWRNTKLRTTGGTIRPVSVWKTGTRNPATNNITKEFTAILLSHQFKTYEKVLSGKWEGREKR
jgi:hypothetical protein